MLWKTFISEDITLTFLISLSGVYTTGGGPGGGGGGGGGGGAITGGTCNGTRTAVAAGGALGGVFSVAWACRFSWSRREKRRVLVSEIQVKT